MPVFLVYLTAREADVEGMHRHIQGNRPLSRPVLDPLRRFWPHSGTGNKDMNGKWRRPLRRDPEIGVYPRTVHVLKADLEGLRAVVRVFRNGFHLRIQRHFPQLPDAVIPERIQVVRHHGRRLYPLWLESRRRACPVFFAGGVIHGVASQKAGLIKRVSHGNAVFCRQLHVRYGFSPVKGEMDIDSLRPPGSDQVSEAGHGDGELRALAAPVQRIGPVRDCAQRYRVCGPLRPGAAQGSIGQDYDAGKRSARERLSKAPNKPHAASQS